MDIVKSIGPDRSAGRRWTAWVLAGCVHAALFSWLAQPAPVWQAARVPLALLEEGDTAPARRFDLAAARMLARREARETDYKAGNGGEPGARMSDAGQERLRRGIDRARRGDCRTRYADMGILAIAPLLIDGVSGAGCKFR